MQKNPWRWAIPGLVLLALAGCGAESTGTAALFAARPASAGFVVGTTSEAEVRAQLGDPQGIVEGRFDADDTFILDRKGTGDAGRRFRYYAQRSQSYGPWPYVQQRSVSRYLDLVFDAAGRLRQVSEDGNDSGWHAAPRMRMM
jgi:hypothetical protein